jgi:hypothetical protein
MKTKTLLLFIFASILLLPSCKKDGTDGGDLTSSIVGQYTNSSTNTTIVVNKIDDTKVSITLNTGSGSGTYDVAFTSVTMNSETSFTLNTVTQDGAVCIGKETFSGTGTHSGNNISLFMTVVGTNPSGITPYDCSGTDTRNVSASK